MELECRVCLRTWRSAVFLALGLLLLFGSCDASCTIGGKDFKDTFVHRYECTRQVLGVCTNCEERTNPVFIGMLVGVCSALTLAISIVVCFLCPFCLLSQRQPTGEEDVKVSLLTPASAAGYQV